MEPASACTCGDGAALTRLHAVLLSLGWRPGFSLFILLRRFLCLIIISHLIYHLPPAAATPPPPQYSRDNKQRARTWDSPRSPGVGAQDPGGTGHCSPQQAALHQVLNVCSASATLQPEHKAPPPAPPTRRGLKAGFNQAFTTKKHKPKALMQSETNVDSNLPQTPTNFCQIHLHHDLTPTSIKMQR